MFCLNLTLLNLEDIGFHFRITWSNLPSFPFCVFWIVSLCSILLMGSFSGLKKYSKDCLQCPKVLLISCNGKIVCLFFKQTGAAKTFPLQQSSPRGTLFKCYCCLTVCSSTKQAWEVWFQTCMKHSFVPGDLELFLSCLNLEVSYVQFFIFLYAWGS